MNVANTLSIRDGSLNFGAGVNSIKVSTVASERNPDGLRRDELAWLVNATVRDGGITQRFGWVLRSKLKTAEERFQGGFIYQPDSGFPYLIASLGGVIYKMDLVTYDVTNLSATAFVQPQPPSITQFSLILKNISTVFPAGSVPSVTVPVASSGALFGSSGTLVSAFDVPQKDSYGLMLLTSASDKLVGDVFAVNISGVSVTFEVLAVTKPFTSPASSTNPPQEEHSYFCQAEQFLIIQAGDGVTLPLIWDGNKLTRSIGINDYSIASPAPNVNQIPAAGAMDYFMGRVWYAQGRTFSAGDIVGGNSGTIQYNFRDAVLGVTENPLCFGGDGFSVPSQSGEIRAIAHSANIDAALGQGRLFIFTRKQVFAQSVPVTRSDWIAADSDNQPLQTVVQLVNGSVNDRSIVAVNGDLFYQSLEPGIRSLNQSLRYFGQWGNVEISANERRILQFNDRSLMRASSGIAFDNRMYQTALPFDTPYGIASRAVIPMDFTPITSFNSQRPPNWEGMCQGISILQLFVGDFGGRERAFALVLSDAGDFDLWEITNSARADFSEDTSNDRRVEWVIEFPAFTWGDEFMMKKLIAAELWIDRLYGSVEFTMEFRPDGQACWVPWHQWKACSPRNSCEDAVNPICYPLTSYLESYRSTMWIPSPEIDKCASATGRPVNIGFQFQPRLTIKGWCRVRGLMLNAEPVMQRLYDQPTC